MEEEVPLLQATSNSRSSLTPRLQMTVSALVLLLLLPFFPLHLFLFLSSMMKSSSFLLIQARVSPEEQQQLLVLHHASKCTHVDGECPQGYRECKVMKELWNHIAKCRNQRCPYSHCVASRWDREKEGGREAERLLGSSHFLLLLVGHL